MSDLTDPDAEPRCGECGGPLGANGTPVAVKRSVHGAWFACSTCCPLSDQ